ncbi:MAG: EamA family transporter [Candidatus Nanopelagicales bacterium]
MSGQPSAAGTPGSGTSSARGLVTSASAVGVGMYLLAALLFAFNGSLAKLAMGAGLDPMHLTQLRNAGAALVLVGYVAVTNRGAFRIRRGELPFLLAYGVIAFVLVQFLYFFTISRLPLGIGTLLAFLAPVVVALWVRFGRGQEVSGRLWGGIGLTLAGLALVAQVWQGLRLDLVGVLAGLLLAVALALYWVLGEAGQVHRDGVSLTMWGFVFASAAWAVIAPWWGFPYDVLGAATDPVAGGFPELPVWAVMVWSVLLGTVIPFLLVIGSLRRIGAQRAGVVATTEPLWAGLIALVLLGETLTWVQALGGCIVIAGVVLAETSRPETAEEQEIPTPV